MSWLGLIVLYLVNESFRLYYIMKWLKMLIFPKHKDIYTHEGSINPHLNSWRQRFFFYLAFLLDK